MKTDFLRLNILNFLAAAVCLIFFVTGQTGTLPFLTLIAVQMILAGVIVNRGASKAKHREARKAVIADNPSLVWRIFGLSLGVPLMIGLGCYYLLGLGFDLTLIVFLGTSYLLQILVNLNMFPYFQRYLTSTFD